jgi:hypothetical protein
MIQWEKSGIDQATLVGEVRRGIAGPSTSRLFLPSEPPGGSGGLDFPGQTTL